MVIKGLTSLLFGLSVSVPSLNAQEIKRITTRYQEADSFKALTSYFTNGDKMGPRNVIRSNEKSWDGMYFIIEFTDRPETFSSKISVTVDVITPFSPDPRKYSFVLENSDHFSWEAYFGITGQEWPDSDAAPLAWKVSVKNFEGNILSEQQSYLWK